MAGGFAAVKAAVESTYPCLGISCADVGKYSTTTACTDPSPSCDVCREKLFEGHCGAFSQEAKGKWDDWTYLYMGGLGVRESECTSDVCCASNEDDCCELNVGAVVGTAIGVLVFLVGSILACCKFFPGCPMNKDGGKPAKRSSAPPVRESTEPLPPALAPIKAETREILAEESTGADATKTKMYHRMNGWYNDAPESAVLRSTWGAYPTTPRALEAWPGFVPVTNAFLDHAGPPVAPTAVSAHLPEPELEPEC